MRSHLARCSGNTTTLVHPCVDLMYMDLSIWICLYSYGSIVLDCAARCSVLIGALLAAPCRNWGFRPNKASPRRGDLGRAAQAHQRKQIEERQEQQRVHAEDALRAAEEVRSPTARFGPYL